VTGVASPRCDIARECGGCARIDEPYSRQLAWKTDRVRVALSRHPSLGRVPVDACVATPEPWRYRNRAKLAVREGGGGLRLGLYRRGSNEIVDLAPCVVQRPVLQAGMETLRAWLERYRLASPAGPVFYADLRETTDSRCHLTLVVSEPGLDPGLLPVAELRDTWPALVGLALNFGDPRSSYPLGRRSVVLFGGAHIEMAVDTLTGERVALEVPVGGFFQVSTSLFPQIHRRMREHLGDEGLLHDLYCGVGVHGLMLALGSGHHDRGIVGVEESAAACEAARANSSRLEIDACYVHGAVEDVLAALVAEGTPSRIVLNPGRSGCKPGALEALPKPGNVAYLSCEPDTLARDLAWLAEHGRHILRATPFDLMPHTDQVEVLALVE
jgi:23S rRNA (uracil1939-C5)-methyltransferase